MKITPSIAVAVMLMAGIVLYSSSTFAAGWRFLQYSAAQKFTDEDWEMLREAGGKALNETPDGQTVSWENPETGSKGTIELARSFEKDGQECRQVNIFNSAGGFSGQSTFSFCKDPASGEWKVQP